MLPYAVRVGVSQLPCCASSTPVTCHSCAATCRYGVKSHLVPHCHYLKSLGISEQELPQLIMSRPQVLVRERKRETLTPSSTG